jgi:hypothetical protein
MAAGSNRASSSSEDDIEMNALQNVVVTPDSRHSAPEFKHQTYENASDEDDDSDDRSEDGNTALLGSTTHNTHSCENLPQNPWKHIRSIVFEACVYIASRKLG